MKKLFLTLAIAAIGFTASYAQTAVKEKLTAEQKAEKSTTRLQKELSLSADQKQKVYAVQLDKFKKADEWRKKGHDIRKAQKDQYVTAKKETDAKLDQILTADQKQKLGVIQTERKAKMENHKGKKHHKGSKSADKA